MEMPWESTPRRSVSSIISAVVSACPSDMPQARRTDTSCWRICAAGTRMAHSPTDCSPDVYRPPAGRVNGPPGLMGWRPGLSALEHVLGKERGHHEVRHVHHVADAEVDGHAADAVGLLAREAALLEELHHGQHGIAAGQIEVLAVVDAVLVDRHAHGGDEALGSRPARIDEIVAARESRPPDAVPLGLSAMHVEADGAGGAHLHRGHAHLAVALGEVPVPGR